MKNIYLTLLMSAIVTTHAYASDQCSSKSKGLVSYTPLTVETTISAISFCDNRSDNACGLIRKSTATYKYSNSTEFNQRRSWEQSSEMRGSFTFEGLSAGGSDSLKNTLEQSYNQKTALGTMVEGTNEQKFEGQFYELTIENDYKKRILYLTNLNQNGWGRAAQGPFTVKETVCIRRDYYPIFNAMLQEIWNQSTGAQGDEWRRISGAASVINTMGKNDQFKEYASRVQKDLANNLDQKRSWDYWQWIRIADSTKNALDFYNKNDAQLAIKNLLDGYLKINRPAHNRDKFDALLQKAKHLAQFSRD